MNLANPHFNVSDGSGERLRDDKRWLYGMPPARNANFAWVQHGSSRDQLDGHNRTKYVFWRCQPTREPAW